MKGNDNQLISKKKDTGRKAAVDRWLMWLSMVGVGKLVVTIVDD
jgi:hypothetical protein